jgi:hypothetical protein
MFFFFLHADSFCRYDKRTLTADSELWDVKLPLVFLPLVIQTDKGRSWPLPYRKPSSNSKTFIACWSVTFFANGITPHLSAPQPSARHPWILTSSLPNILVLMNSNGGSKSVIYVLLSLLAFIWFPTISVWRHTTPGHLPGYSVCRVGCAVIREHGPEVYIGTTKRAYIWSWTFAEIRRCKC